MVSSPNSLAGLNSREVQLKNKNRMRRLARNHRTGREKSPDLESKARRERLSLTPEGSGSIARGGSSRPWMAAHQQSIPPRQGGMSLLESAKRQIIVDAKLEV